MLATSSITSDKDIITNFAAMANLKTQGGTVRPFFKDCNAIGDEVKQRRAGFVALITKNEQMYNNLNAFFTALNYSTRRYASVEEMDNFIISDDYGKSLLPNGVVPNTVCLGISFQEESGKNWAYSLHFNSSGNPTTVDIPDSIDIQEEPFKEELAGATDDSARYGSSGVMILQGLIDNLILRQATGASGAFIQSRMIKMPVMSYSDSGLYSNTNSGQIDIYIIFPLLVIYLGFIYHMLKEKERKVTENMRNMGMSLLPHYLSWWTFYTCVLFISSIVWAIIVNATFFRHSNFICVWMLYFLPGFVLLSLAFIVCSFFITAKPGVLTGIITFFLLYAVTIGKTSVDAPTEAIYNGFAISPFAGLSFAGANMVLLESTNNFGFGFANISQTINFFKYGTFIAICIMEAFGLFFIGIYLDQVWPTEIGIKKHPLFFLGIGYKKEKDDGKHEKTDAEYAKLNYEQVPPELLQNNDKEMISIKHLRKVYSNGKVAVHDLSLEMFNNQIFALLGHNGAGKTTTISMISGLLTQTSGSITICGYDTKTQYDDVKSILGVCPQQNPIYDNLTCEEHLRLYGNLKLNGRGSVSDEEINQILKDIDLFDKKSYVAGKLSGGQKRKLCIGIAFIGGSKVILLDEPTSGMDTYARRFLWEMIKKYKKDRIIILCTHYMDEADFLGDRFGIMGEGRLITCGSSLFLKKRFGVGYDLTVVKESIQTSTEKIVELVKKKVPASEMLANISMEIKFRLPNEQSGLFEGLFKEMEDEKAQYGIQSFGISLTTLEEVFLRVAVGINHGTKQDNKEKDGKRLPIEGEQQKLREDAINDYDLETIRIKGRMEIFNMHFLALIKKRFIYFKRDYKGVFCEIVLPILIMTAGLIFTLITFVKDPVAKDYLPSEFYSRTVSVWSNEAASSLASTADIRSILDKMSGVPRWNVEKRTNAASIEDFQALLQKERDPARYVTYYFDRIDNANKAYHYSVFYNNTVATSMVIGVNQMNNAIFKVATGDNAAKIKIRYAGLRLTQQIATFNDVAVGFIAVFSYALAYSFIPAGVILFIVKERENNAKHQQIVSGVSIFAYWFSNLLIDVIKYMIPGIFCALSVLIFNISAYRKDDIYGMVWTLVLLYLPDKFHVHEPRVGSSGHICIQLPGGLHSDVAFLRPAYHSVDP
jgi:ATP-binding cassette subfamily A (ABC1) protein 3